MELVDETVAELDVANGGPVLVCFLVVASLDFTATNQEFRLESNLHLHYFYAKSHLMIMHYTDHRLMYQESVNLPVNLPLFLVTVWNVSVDVSAECDNVVLPDSVDLSDRGFLFTAEMDLLPADEVGLLFVAGAFLPVVTAAVVLSPADVEGVLKT